MTRVELASVTDWVGYSRAVRRLLADGVAPEQVRWRIAGETPADLFDADGDAAPSSAGAFSEPPALHLPRRFVEAARDAFLHADEARFALLHRLSMRIAADARAWDEPLDPDRLRLERLRHDVQREIHKMHAFVRFRPVETAEGVRHVAWFEPGHHVAEPAAGFFARRFAAMRWSLLTPRVRIDWDGGALRFGPGAGRDAAPAADAGEALWLAYYRSIFNPARVKLATMKKEMPVRFWRNLPEAAAIAPLVAAADERRSHMVAAAADTRRRRGARSAPEAAVDALDALRRDARRCRDCPVADRATQAVFGEGDSRARLMIVGEQPGDEEDLRGRPFQGPAGRLLREAFATLGWDASRLWLTNAVKHFHHELRGRRRMHRTPGQQEAEACLRWLDAEIEVLRPEAIVALGATAARSLLGRPVSVTQHEGEWIAREDGIPVLVCLHPAALLRADPARRAGMQARWLAALEAASAFA